MWQCKIFFLFSQLFLEFKACIHTNFANVKNDCPSSVSYSTWPKFNSLGPSLFSEFLENQI